MARWMWVIVWWRTPKRIASLVLIIAMLSVVGFHTIPSDTQPFEAATWGVTFTQSHAAYLGLDWKTLYREMLDDLGVRWIRIGVEWNRIEPEPGRYLLKDIEWQLDEAAKRGARVLLAIGRKLPRWPECRVPSWVKELPRDQQEVRTLAMIRNVVEAFSSHPAVWAWQVENEPLFRFGECSAPDAEFYRQEVSVVRSLDTRPIVGTDSGELSTWWRMSGFVDILGVSIYRSVYNRVLGYQRYPFSPAAYHRKARLVSGRVSRIISTEVQMEPWSPGGIIDSPVVEQFRSFPIKRFGENIEFAKKTGFDTFYLWGVEWWAWMRDKHNDGRFWEEAKQLYRL